MGIMEKQKQYKIKGAITKIESILSDLESYSRFHPLIQAAHPINNNDKINKSYNIIERPFLWLPIKVKYKAKVMSSDHTIIYKITGLPLTTATIKYQLQQQVGEPTIIDFHLSIDSKLLGKKILGYKMMKAQDELMAVLAQEMNENCKSKTTPK